MTTTWGEAEAAEFLRAQGFGLGPFSIRRLTGGLWNDVLLVETPARRMILKHYRGVLPGTLFPNLPDAEAAALQRLAGLEVAPDLIGFWPGDNVLLYDYVEGALWSDEVGAVAQLLARKQAADPSGFRPVPLSPADITAQGDALMARCPASPLVADWQRHRPRPVTLAAPERLSLIHTDIGAGNLVGAGAGLRLIDWQCPAAGDLAEDLFSFLSPAFQVINARPVLDAGQRRQFFEALEIAGAQTRHAALEPFYAYRMAAYCCLRAETATEPELRARYARAARAELAQLQEPA